MVEPVVITDANYGHMPPDQQLHYLLLDFARKHSLDNAAMTTLLQDQIAPRIQSITSETNGYKSLVGILENKNEALADQAKRLGNALNQQGVQ